jgi:hypothetical protein
MRSQNGGGLPLAHQLEALIKSVLSGYREAFDDTGNGASVDFQMPLTYLRMNIYESEKKILDKMLKEGTIDQEKYDQRLEITPKGKIKVAYMRLEKHTKTVQYRAMTYKDWVPGNVVQKLDKDVKGWSEIAVPENVDIPEDVELAMYRVEYKPTRKELLYHTQYPFLTPTAEKEEPWKQVIFYRVICHLMMGGIEYAEALHQMEEREKMKKVAAEMESEETKTVNVGANFEVQPVKTMRNEQPLSKSDKEYKAWLAKERKKAGVVDPKSKKK